MDFRVRTQKSFHNFKGHQVRHVMIEGEPWFVAADVCRALGLYISDRGQANVTVALRKVEQAETRLYPIQTPVPTKADHVTEMKVVSEPGLYMLIMRSDKPEAATFQDWVTREVLPAIRKTGGYLLNEEARATAAADQRDEMPIPQTYPDALRAENFWTNLSNKSGRAFPHFRRILPATAGCIHCPAALSDWIVKKGNGQPTESGKDGPIGTEMATARGREETAVFCGFQVGRSAYPN
ncbi:prophage antirepressor-like protein [Sphingosinicella microcystinivorans]|nr:prophage antirepressor-like protein [Sphingosinicella microcystinivorans]